MDALFAAHSGTRYLVLLVGVIALLWFVWGLGTNRPFSRPAPAIFAVFVGLLDLQALMGIVLLIGRDRPPGIWGHVALMILAVTLAHSMKKSTRRSTGYGRPLLGVAGALALIVVGILAIGRPLV
jgi:uncharacterized membrane protein YphA (DoxX/SURF4 family)